MYLEKGLVWYPQYFQRNWFSETEELQKRKLQKWVCKKNQVKKEEKKSKKG